MNVSRLLLAAAFILSLGGAASAGPSTPNPAEMIKRPDVAVEYAKRGHKGWKGHKGRHYGWYKHRRHYSYYRPYRHRYYSPYRYGYYKPYRHYGYSRRPRIAVFFGF